MFVAQEELLGLPSCGATRPAVGWVVGNIIVSPKNWGRWLRLWIEVWRSKWPWTDFRFGTVQLHLYGGTYGIHDDHWMIWIWQRDVKELATDLVHFEDNSTLFSTLFWVPKWWFIIFPTSMTKRALPRLKKTAQGVVENNSMKEAMKKAEVGPSVWV